MHRPERLESEQKSDAILVDLLFSTGLNGLRGIVPGRAAQQPAKKALWLSVKSKFHRARGL
jgi:hypothetical protein